VFAALREKFGICTADYLVSLTSEYLMSELPTPGKSGSLFYYSHDYRFLVKTITSGEQRTFRRMLPNYYLHVIQNKDTLLPKFFGLHRVSMKGKSCYFVVMWNIFPATKEIHEKYDLKGSTAGRSATSEEKKNKNVILKDMDITRTLMLGPVKRDLFMKQLEMDVAFLQQQNVMDYSLLLGVHNTKSASDSSIFVKLPRYSRASITLFMNTDDNKENGLTVSMSVQNDEPSTPEPVAKSYDYPSIFNKDDAGFRASTQSNENYPEIYYFGIIDILVEYNVKKKIEHSYKTKFETAEISSVDPITYARRFKRFIFSRLQMNDKERGSLQVELSTLRPKN